MNEDETTEDELDVLLQSLYLKGAVETLHKVARHLAANPKTDALEYIRALADQVIFQAPGILE